MVLKIGIPQEVDQKYVGSFEMWFWRRRDISWTDHVKYDVLHLYGRVRFRMVSLEFFIDIILPAALWPRG